MRMEDLFEEQVQRNKDLELTCQDLRQENEGLRVRAATAEHEKALLWNERHALGIAGARWRTMLREWLGKIAALRDFYGLASDPDIESAMAEVNDWTLRNEVVDSGTEETGE